MQFSKIFLVAATVASAAAAPTGELETRTAAPIKCQHHGGKWKYGWEGAADNEKYTCNTAGLLVSYQFLLYEARSVLMLTVPYSERPDLCQHPQRQHRQRQPALHPRSLRYSIANEVTRTSRSLWTRGVEAMGVLSGDSGVVFLSFSSDAAGRFGMRRHADTHSLYV
jgi:hypothetical protein